MDARLIGKTPTGYEITAGTDIFGNNFRFCIAKFIDGSEAAVIFSPIDESAEDAVRRCATETIQCTTEPIKFSIVLAKLYGIREFAAITKVSNPNPDAMTDEAIKTCARNACRRSKFLFPRAQPDGI